METLAWEGVGWTELGAGAGISDGLAPSVGF